MFIRLTDSRGDTVLLNVNKIVCVEKHHTGYFQIRFEHDGGWMTVKESLEEIEALVNNRLSPNTPQQLKETHTASEDLSSQFVVRLWDGSDRLWIDIFGPADKWSCQDKWDQETENGSRNSKFEDGDYYAIFPAGTKMLRSE